MRHGTSKERARSGEAAGGRCQKLFNVDSVEILSVLVKFFFGYDMLVIEIILFLGKVVVVDQFYAGEQQAGCGNGENYARAEGEECRGDIDVKQQYRQGDVLQRERSEICAVYLKGFRKGLPYLLAAECGRHEG